MPRAKSDGRALTPLELEIMSVLWETGPVNVQAVQERLKGRSLAYTTVQTMLNVLHRKGRVKRELRDRAYVYRPVLSRQKAVKQALNDLLERFFGGSADGLVLNLIQSHRLTPEKIVELQNLVDRPKEEDHGND